MNDAVQALAAIAQDSRLRVFRLLVRQGAAGMAAGDIARALDLPASTLSAHLSILVNAGLIRSERQSRSILYSLDVAATRALLGFLLEDCCQGQTELCSPLLDNILTDCCGPGLVSACGPSQGDRS